MCPGNRAAAATYWINSQLETLWKLSVECAEKHCHGGIKPSRPDIAHGTCLAQFGIGKHPRTNPTAEDLTFFATFSAPNLTFICNHDVLIQFRLKSGHLKHSNKGGIEHFEGYTCAFRVPFRQHTITDTTLFSTGQVDSCKAKFLILDLDNAMFVREHSGFTDGHNLTFDEVDRKQRVIVKHLRSDYISILQKSGFHFIQSLPDFDNLTRAHHIDWSVITEIEIDTLSVHDVNVDMVNTYLKARWLEAAGCVDELEDDHDHSLFGQFALAEHRAACDDFHFHAFFGPPQIRALCSREVIFFIDVQDLHFYMDGEFTGEAHHRFSKWRIAVVVDVHFVEEEEGSVRRLKLDFSKARFCHSLSTCDQAATHCEDSLLIKLRTSFISYITTRYLFVLEEHHHSHIYRIDIRVVEEEVDYEEIDIDFSFEEYRESLCITNTFGFDILTTLTQSSINYHLRCLWKASHAAKSILSHWCHNKYFEASFGAPQIQLPSGNGSDSVILYVTLREGSLTCLDRLKKSIGGERHGFSGWKLAFEIKLKSREYTKSCPISDGYLKGHHHHSIGEYVNYQLYLDFKTAKFRQDLSRLPGLFDDTHYLLMRSKRQALVYYMITHYLEELKRQGYHVLYTIPIWKSKGSCGITPFAPTSISHQFYGGSTETSVSSLFGHNHAFGNRNMIVICGMLDREKRPSFPLPDCSWRWCSSDDAFCGTVALSRKVFLEGWLLAEFKHINRRTTLIPRFRGIEHHGKWKFDLVSLEKDDKDNCRTCEWKEIACHEHYLEFEHRNKDMWTFEHESDCDDLHNGFYSVSCETLNTLHVPTISKHGVCEIIITGKVSLNLAFKGGKNTWSTSAVAKWSSSIYISNVGHGNGLKISTSSSHDISDGLHFIGDFDIVRPGVKDACTLLREQLAEIVIVEDKTIKQFETYFCGLWPLFYSGTHGYTLCNAVFNSCGDLLFELESPMDGHGQVMVSGRPDLAILTKKPTTTYRPGWSLLERAVEAVESVAPQLFRENSTLTSSTGLDSPVKTPNGDHTHHDLQPKIALRDAYPEGEDEDGLEGNELDTQMYEKERPHYENEDFNFDRASGLTA